MEEKQKLSRARIQTIVMTDLMFRSPLWALLILLIYGIIMSGAIWFLLHVVKPSIDRKIEQKRNKEKAQVKRNTGKVCRVYECNSYVGRGA